MEGPRIAQNRMIYELMNQDNADLACNDKLQISQKIANMTDKDKQADLIAQLITFKYYRQDSVYSDSQQNACWEHIENKHLLSGDNNEKLLSKEELMFFVKNRNQGLFAQKIPATFLSLISNLNEQEKIIILLKIYKDHPETAENIMTYLGNVTGQNWSFNLQSEKQNKIQDLTTIFFAEVKRKNDRGFQGQASENLYGWTEFIINSTDGIKFKENIMNYCLDNNVSKENFVATLSRMPFNDYNSGLIEGNSMDTPKEIKESFAFDVFKAFQLNTNLYTHQVKPSDHTLTLIEHHKKLEKAQQNSEFVK
jgi:hypothetical protein